MKKARWLWILLLLIMPVAWSLEDITREGEPSRVVFGQSIVYDEFAYLPAIFSQRNQFRVNARKLSGNDWLVPASIFWFGKVTATDNYADVRIGYNPTELVVQTTVFDRWLWYDTKPTAQELLNYDSISLVIKTAGPSGSAPDSRSYKFVAQSFPNYLAYSSYMASYKGNGSGWSSQALPFSIRPGYRGNGGYNQVNVDNRGWNMTFIIPYSSLGITGEPPAGTTWSVGVLMNDRDQSSGSVVSKNWPPESNQNTPATWGVLGFGLPTYTPPAYQAPQAITIRQGLNASSVPDASVGGSTVCGGGTDFFSTWGNTPESFYADKTVNNTQFNIQNQGDVADFPCFARYYVTFPLDALPKGKVIISATLSLHQFGNAGVPNDPNPPTESLIHVMTSSGNWDEATLTWNNGPLALENFAAAWVPPIQNAGDLGVERVWTISAAVARAYQENKPLRLILYSTDAAMNSGKYFWASNRPDGEASRPTITINYGSPIP